MGALCSGPVAKHILWSSRPNRVLEGLEVRAALHVDQLWERHAGCPDANDASLGQVWV